MDELIHKLYLVKFIDCDIYLDIVFCIKNKYLQLLYDKIMVIDDGKINNIMKFCERMKIHNNVFHNFYITSKCDPIINSCQQCQTINNFIKHYGNQKVYLLRNNNIINRGAISTYPYSYSCSCSCSCDNYNYELFFHDPNRILLVYGNQSNENSYLLCSQKYICLMDFICHYIGISKETFKNSFSYNISMESSKKENNKFYHVKINTQH